MEYGIRARGLSGNDSGVGPGTFGLGAGGGLPAGWLETAALGAAYGNHPLLAAYQLPASSAVLLLNSLQNFQSSAASAMEQLAWKQPDRTTSSSVSREDSSEDKKADADEEPKDAQDDEDDEEGEEDEDEEEEKEASFENWKEASTPVLSSWMLSAYATFLGRLSAATAAYEATEGSNLASDGDSESDRSSSTDMLSRESSPSSSVRQAYGTDQQPKGAQSRTSVSKKRRTSDVKSRKSSNNNNNNSQEQQATASDANASDTSSSSQGKKRSLALQRVRYRYEREEYRCSLCSYACTIEKAFQRHLRAHARGTASDSKVSCAVCGADRGSEVELSRHMRRHRDNRYFCCDICVFRTVQLKKLIQHRRMHTGEKPHKCPYCVYRSARRDNLRSHVRRVHKKENLYCDTFSPRGMFVAAKLQQRAPEDQQLPEIEEELPPASPELAAAASSSPAPASPRSGQESEVDEPID